MFCFDFAESFTKLKRFKHYIMNPNVGTKFVQNYVEFLQVIALFEELAPGHEDRAYYFQYLANLAEDPSYRWSHEKVPYLELLEGTSPLLRKFCIRHGISLIQ